MNAAEPDAAGSPKAVETVELVRPGPVGLDWLARTIRAVQGGDPWRPVTLIVPNLNAGRQARWHLARQGGYLDVRSLRLGELAALLAAGGTGARQPLDDLLEAAALRAALRRAGGKLQPLAHHPSLHQVLGELFRELRRREIEPEPLLGGSGSALVAAALDIYRAYRALTEELVDATDLRELAGRRLARPELLRPVLDELGSLVFWLPTRLDPADVRLLGALARAGARLVAACPDLGDSGDAELPGRAAAALLARELGRPVPPEGRSGATIDPSTDVRVLRAPDPAEELREITRALAADLADGRPLHRAAILYRQGDPYAALTREALDRAGLPWVALEGRPLSDSRAGRGLLALLRLAEREFSREAVLAWLELEPRVAGVAAPFGAGLADRLSRAANVVRGADQWTERLSALSRELAARSVEQARAGLEAAARESADLSDQARALAEVLDRVKAGLEPPAAGSWGDLAAWAENLRDGFAGPGPTWSADERAASDQVAATLADLGRADRFEAPGGATLGAFVAALEQALQGRRLSVGRLGQGILVGPVQAIAGLTFERVFLVGLVEGSFPPPSPPDPFFPLESDDPLGRAARQRAAERQQLLTALAAADGGRLDLSTTDAAAGRAAFPSPWLLELVGERFFAGRPLHSADFRALDPARHPWLRVVGSALEGARSAAAPADLEDRRLGEAARWVQAGRRLADHPLGRRPALPVRAGLTLQRARGSSRLTAYDGKLTNPDGPASRPPAGRRALSASAVEAFSACPFRYFLGHVLRVRPTERPLEGWTIDPLERGRLIHTALEQFFARLARDGRPRPDERYTPADQALLEQVAEEQLAAAARRGVTGHPLIWETVRAGLLADLRAFLAEDERERRDSGLQPTYFEQAFGADARDAWPAVALVADGLPLTFLGYIDRVDVDEQRRRARVYDYKTGRAEGYAGLDDDPVLGGQHLQLALYREAVRGALGTSFEVDGAYWFVTSAGERRRVRLPADPTRVDAALAAALDRFGAGLRSGAFPQVPGEVDREGGRNCRYCDYQRVCPGDVDLLAARKRPPDPPAGAGP